jgi:hypothetical protein
MDQAWIVELSIVALLGLTCGALVAAWLHGHLEVAAVALFVGALVVWVADFAALASGFRDANEFTSCGESCSTTHVVSAVGFLAPPLLVSLAAAAGLVAIGARWHARRSR